MHLNCVMTSSYPSDLCLNATSSEKAFHLVGISALEIYFLSFFFFFEIYFLCIVFIITYNIAICLSPSFNSFIPQEDKLCGCWV